jgi:amidase
VQNTVQAAANALQGICKTVTEDRPEALNEIDQVLRQSILLGGDEGKWLTDIFEKIQLKTPSPLLLEYLELAKKCKLSVTDLRVSWMRFDQFRQHMLDFIKNYDVILCPVAATPAKKHGLSFKEVADFSYSICYSLVSWPVVVVRCGTSEDGLPIGIQIIAKPWREDVALRVAAYLEKQLGGWQLPTNMA